MISPSYKLWSTAKSTARQSNGSTSITHSDERLTPLELARICTGSAVQDFSIITFAQGAGQPVRPHSCGKVRYIHLLVQPFAFIGPAIRRG